MAEKRGRQPLIAAVDDDDDFRFLLSLWLSLHYDFESFNSGEALLSRLGRLKPDLVVLDFGLPRMTGVEVARLIRRSEGFFSLPILFLTGMPPDRLQGAFPVDDHTAYLIKPIECADLVTGVDRLLSVVKVMR